MPRFKNRVVRAFRDTSGAAASPRLLLTCPRGPRLRPHVVTARLLGRPLFRRRAERIARRRDRCDARHWAEGEAADTGQEQQAAELEGADHQESRCNTGAALRFTMQRRPRSINRSAAQRQLSLQPRWVGAQKGLQLYKSTAFKQRSKVHAEALRRPRSAPRKSSFRSSCRDRGDSRQAKNARGD